MKRTTILLVAVFGFVAGPPAAAAERPASPKAIHFEIKKEVILLDVTVDGKGPYKFLLDTGAGATVLSPDLAKALALKSDKKGDAVGAGGGKSDVSVARVKSVAIGDTRRDDLEVVILDIANVGSAIGITLYGIVGYTFLREYRVVIDYPGQTVQFERPDRK
jgi:predicted aspartyl protease